MINFCKHILLILLVIFLSAYALEDIYDYTFINTSARDKTQLALKQNQGHVNYLFLGNSRVENYIDCTVIKEVTGKSCKNFALSGGSYKDAFVLLYLLKKQGLTFDHLFLQLDTALNSETMSESFKSSLVPFIEVYQINMEEVDLDLTWSQRNLPFYKYAQYDYLYGVRSCAAQLYKNTDKEIQMGYVPRYKEGTAFAKNISSIQFKNRFVDLLQKQAIKDKAEVHFFTSPYCVEMRNTVIFDQLFNYYPDYINYSSFYSQPEYFVNCTHMNDSGAQVFTRQLVTDFNL
jgi:hypothetical protein